MKAKKFLAVLLLCCLPIAVGAQGIIVYEKSATDASIDGSEDVVLDSTFILRLTNVSIQVRNTHATQPFTDVNIYVSNDGLYWTVLAAPACDTMAAAAAPCIYAISGNGYGYIKVGVTAAAGGGISSASVTLSANNG